MKEASGELSMTAIAVVAIAAIGVLFYQFVWPSIQANIQRNSYCSQAFNCTDCDGTTCTCTYLDEDGDDDTITCPDNSTDVTG